MSAPDIHRNADLWAIVNECGGSLGGLAAEVRRLRAVIGEIERQVPDLWDFVAELQDDDERHASTLAILLSCAGLASSSSRQGGLGVIERREETG